MNWKNTKNNSNTIFVTDTHKNDFIIQNDNKCDAKIDKQDNKIIKSINYTDKSGISTQREKKKKKY